MTSNVLGWIGDFLIGMGLVTGFIGRASHVIAAVLIFAGAALVLSALVVRGDWTGVSVLSGGLFVGLAYYAHPAWRFTRELWRLVTTWTP